MIKLDKIIQEKYRELEKAYNDLISENILRLEKKLNEALAKIKEKEK